ncbi:MAG: LytR family transcriptional regulator [Ruminococcaceae bacterium]|nr:LytR family transcriptional regulator [Oscillospiraceae bacterium]
MTDKNFQKPTEFDDPYDRGFADKLYEDFPCEPQYVVFDPNCTTQGIPTRKQPKKHRLLKGILIFLFVFLLLLAFLTAFLYFYSDCPNDGKNHKSNVSTILIAGTDESGLRTDTLMLLCADREQKTINLMSIPRDTKVNSSYYPQKINLAYHMNGADENGMYWLMDYVRQCVGFRPDGYVLLDLDCFTELVDLFGGVEFEVPCRMQYSDSSQGLYIDLQPGLQTLNGKDAMGLVRFRSGYEMADLERVNVQRDFMMTAFAQWASPTNATKIFSALDILEEYSITDLSSRNLLWFAWSLLICGTDDMYMTTIPYDLSGEYVCIRANDEYLELLNTYFNPYKTEITYAELNIAR